MALTENLRDEHDAVLNLVLGSRFAEQAFHTRPQPSSPQSRLVSRTETAEPIGRQTTTDSRHISVKWATDLGPGAPVTYFVQSLWLVGCLGYVLYLTAVCAHFEATPQAQLEGPPRGLVERCPVLGFAVSVDGEYRR